MNAYANVPLALEKMRVRALSAQRGSPLPAGADQEVDSEPPRVLVLGPENSGKTTVCKILANYAVRAGQGWTPMFVNADPSEVGVFFSCVFFFGLCVGCFMLEGVVVVGRMDRPGHHLGRGHNCATWHRFACEPVGLGRDVGADHSVVQRASSVGLLVRPPRDQAESAPDGPPHP